MGVSVLVAAAGGFSSEIVVFFVLLAVFVVMTFVGLFAMKADKEKAKKGKWRTKEATLFLIAFFMGGVGTTCGMQKYRHKTNHWYFKYGMPALAVLNVLTLVASAVLAFR